MALAYAFSQPVLADDLPPLDPGVKPKEAHEWVDPMKLGGSEYCGHCHTDIFHQWNASTHHFSSFNNPVYRKVVTRTIERKGQPTFAFCANCHDPILKSSGETDKLDADNWKANAGITCLSCHRIMEIGAGNGDYRIAEPTLHPFALSDNPTLAKAHKTMIELTPWLHRRVLTKPFYGNPEYCAACHSLTVPSSINGLAPISLTDEFGQLHRRHQNVHGEDLPGRCIDCHMPEVPSNDPAAKDGLIRSHRFAGSNTALPTFNRDLDQREVVETFLSSGIVALRVAGVRTRPEDPFRSGEEVPAQAGDHVEIALEVRNVRAGHQFPTGTVDSNEAWLSTIVTDANARALVTLGQIDEQGLVPADAIRFGTRFVDAAGNFTDRRNTTSDAVSIAEDSVIPIRGSRTVFVGFTIPANAASPFTALFTLNWRKYSPAFIAWVFDGRDTPPLPVTPLASLRLTLPATTSINRN
ncbi:MAG: multiheme c-type cytochrome [Methylococcaceae bacterium]|nr:multiheme c-type cytochrome [Methylococcaceae bacterium]